LSKFNLINYYIRNDLNEHIVILILGYQNLAIQNEMMHNYHNALLYYEIAESLFTKLQSWNDKIKLDKVNKMIDENYKLKIINKIKNEKNNEGVTSTDKTDKIGQYFIKK
jgi:hypothetical protein